MTQPEIGLKSTRANHNPKWPEIWDPSRDPRTATLQLIFSRLFLLQRHLLQNQHFLLQSHHLSCCHHRLIQIRSSPQKVHASTRQQRACTKPHDQENHRRVVWLAQFTAVKSLLKKNRPRNLNYWPMRMKQRYHVTPLFVAVRLANLPKWNYLPVPWLRYDSNKLLNH